MSEHIIGKDSLPEGGNGKLAGEASEKIGGNGNPDNINHDKKEALPPADSSQKQQSLPSDFKVAEIWIKNGQVFLEATESFWDDKCRAIGLLELCKDIVKRVEIPSKKSKIIPASNQMMNFVRRTFRKRKR